MIHGVYLRSKQKNSWHLIQTFTSVEEASKIIDNIRKQMKKEENEDAEIGVKIFETSFYIPEILKDITPQTLMYN